MLITSFEAISFQFPTKMIALHIYVRISGISYNHKRFLVILPKNSFTFPFFIDSFFSHFIQMIFPVRISKHLYDLNANLKLFLNLFLSAYLKLVLKHFWEALYLQMKWWLFMKKKRRRKIRIDEIDRKKKLSCSGNLSTLSNINIINRSTLTIAIITNNNLWKSHIYTVKWICGLFVSSNSTFRFLRIF